MATSPPVQHSAPVPNTQNGAPLQQNMYMMPVPQQEHASPRIIRPVPGIKCLSIAILVLGSVIVILGIVAIVLKAFASYIADPVWTGVLFLITTGILGIFVHKKKNNLCLNIAFLVMCIISSAFAYQLMEVTWTLATREHGWEDHCHPLGYYGRTSYDCSAYWVRVLVAVVIGFCALAVCVLCIVSCSVTLYGTFTCCYNCCRCCRNGSQSQATVQYSNHTGVIMTPIPGNGVQVMITSQIPAQGFPVMQQGQMPNDGSKTMFVMAAPQAYLQSSPPAYASSPEAFIVASNQQSMPVAVSNPTPQLATGNPQLSGGNQVYNPTVVASNPLQVNSQSGGGIANNPENWQKF